MKIQLKEYQSLFEQQLELYLKLETSGKYNKVLAAGYSEKIAANSFRLKKIDAEIIQSVKNTPLTQRLAYLKNKRRSMEASLTDSLVNDKETIREKLRKLTIEINGVLVDLEIEIFRKTRK